MPGRKELQNVQMPPEHSQFHTPDNTKMKAAMKLKIFSTIIIVSAMMAISGCGTPTQIYTSILDFRPYSDEGLFISPNSYPEAHKTLGEIYIEVHPGKSMAYDKSDSKFQDPLYGRRSSRQVYENFKSEDLLELCVQEAVKLGANGVSNFRLKAIYTYTRNGRLFSHYEITGLAIKIEEPR